MRHRLFDNWGLKLLSLVLGCVVWLVVLNIDDYSTTRQIKEIPVTLVNTDAVTDQNKLYDIVSGETVDIIVKGRRSVISELDASDFSAVADLSKLSITNAVNITVTANEQSVENSISITVVDSVLQVELEDEQTASLQVTVSTQGEPAEGYTIGAPVATPNLITVTGAASLIARIDKAEVLVDVTGRTSDVTASCTPTFYDANGEEISTKNLESKVSEVSVTVPIYRTKQVSVKLNTKGTPAEDYMVANVEYGPTEITVGGPIDQLAKLTEITLDDIDVSGCTEDVETTVELAGYLPDGIVLAEDTTTISVHITIERSTSRTLTLTADDITIQNKEADCTYEVTFPNGSTLIVSGLSGDISELTAKELGVTIDAETLSVGANTVELSIPDSDTYTVEGVITATVEVTEMP